MAGNSWQQPVSGETSVGTPKWHWKELYNGNPSATTWQTIDLTSEVPVGASMISVVGTFQETGGAGRIIEISNATAGTAYITDSLNGSFAQQFSGFLPLTSSRILCWNVDNADVDSVIINMSTYFL